MDRLRATLSFRDRFGIADKFRGGDNVMFDDGLKITYRRYYF